MLSITRGLQIPSYDIQELSDGNLLIMISQEGEPTTRFILHPQSSVVLAQRLLSRVLGRNLEGPAGLQALQ